MLVRRRRRGVALSHQHPAAIGQHRLAGGVETGRADIDDSGLAVRALLEADHLGDGGQRLARIDRLEKAPVRIAEIGDGVERDVGHGLAEHDVEDEPVVEGASRVPDRLGEGIRGLHREARAVERGVERGVARRDGARGCVANRLAEPEVLEEAPRIGLHRLHLTAPARRCPRRRQAAVYGVAHEAGDGHRPDAAGHRRDRARDLTRLGEGDVADEPGLALAGGGVRHPVDADVDHDRAGLHPVAADHLGAADGGDEDVGAPAQPGEVARFRVRDRDGAALVDQELRHRLADDVRAPDHNGVEPGEVLGAPI